MSDLEIRETLDLAYKTISFLRSCILCGESLNHTDEQRISSVLKHLTEAKLSADG